MSGGFRFEDDLDCVYMSQKRSNLPLRVAGRGGSVGSAIGLPAVSVFVTLFCCSPR